MISFFNKNGNRMVQGSQDGHKKLLRGRCREIYASLDDAYISDASLSIARKVIDMPEFVSAKTIFCYMSMDREVATDEIISAAFEAGKRVCIPLCVDAGGVDEGARDEDDEGERAHIMEARVYRPGDELVSGAYGIREPGPGACVVSPEEIDLAIVPCVATDRFCNRMGHGAGYYDRFLNASAGSDHKTEKGTNQTGEQGKPNFKKICLCFDKLIMGSIPITAQDVPMDAVVTETEIYKRDAETTQVTHSGAR